VAVAAPGKPGFCAQEFEQLGLAVQTGPVGWAACLEMWQDASLDFLQQLMLHFELSPFWTGRNPYTEGTSRASVSKPANSAVRIELITE
jgi:hypothetical protein